MFLSNTIHFQPSNNSQKKTWVSYFDLKQSTVPKIFVIVRYQNYVMNWFFVSWMHIQGRAEGWFTILFSHLLWQLHLTRILFNLNSYFIFELKNWGRSFTNIGVLFQYLVLEYWLQFLNIIIIKKLCRPCKQYAFIISHLPVTFITPVAWCESGFFVVFFIK